VAGTEKFEDRFGVIVVSNPHPLPTPWASQGASHAIQWTDRRPELRLELVILCQCPTRVPILQ